MFAFLQRRYLSWQRCCAKLDVLVLFWIYCAELWMCSWWLSAENKRVSREILREKIYKIAERFDRAYPASIEEKKIEQSVEKRPKRIRRELNRLKY